MSKNYQNQGRRAGTGRTTPKMAKLSPEQKAQEAAVSLPASVTVAIAELAGEMEEGMLALVVGAGLKVIDVLFEEEVTVLAGPKGRHDPGHAAARHGSDDGLVTLGARQLSVRRPRLRSADGHTEVPLTTYEWAKDAELLGTRDHGPNARQAVHPPLRRGPRVHGGRPSRRRAAGRRSRRCRGGSWRPPSRR